MSKCCNQQSNSTPSQLDAFFKPKSVALIGATDRQGAVGRTILHNLIETSFGGEVFPVNPTKTEIMGQKAYKTIGDVPKKCDLAIICIPAKAVVGSVEECGKAGVKGLIIISAGFKEIGPEGAALEDQCMELARKYGMRIMGPNCLGMMVPTTGLNASFAACMSLKGHVSFISQSGALMTALLDWTMKEGVGFSSFISIGSMLDVDFGDIIEYLGNDPETHSILIYMESIGNAESFLRAAKRVSQKKPIVVIKPGRSSAAAAAAASHTGSLTGSDDVLTAAFERVGVVRVDEIDDLFQMSSVLDKQPIPKGPRLAIISNAGGPGVISTDALIMGGGELAPISEESLKAYNSFLPAAWSHHNPIDILGDAPPINYAKALEVAGKDENTDAVLVILTPQSVTDCTGSAVELAKFAHIGKPVYASWMGGRGLDEGRDILRKAGIPTFDHPDRACRLFNYMWSTQKLLEKINVPPKAINCTIRTEEAKGIVEKAYSEGRDLLTELESKQLLSAYGIPTVPTIFAQTAEDAANEAEKLGYPIVLKLHSYTITHKTDVGGVQLNLRNKEEVRQAFVKIQDNLKKLGKEEGFQGVTVQPMLKLSEGYELIIGSTMDNQLGPVCVFGGGGTLVEVNKDSSLALPPLNSTLANLCMEKTKIFKALKGIRGRKSCDMDLLTQILVNFSKLTIDIPYIREMDINPLLATPTEIIALDARVVLFKSENFSYQYVKAACKPNCCGSNCNKS